MSQSSSFWRRPRKSLPRCKGLRSRSLRLRPESPNPFSANLHKMPLLAQSCLSRLRVVCVSDTHNDDPSTEIPSGDILIHAGDIIDRGSSFEQYVAAVSWISNLPHAVKVVTAGNAEVELDPNGRRFDPKVLELFTNDAAKKAGLVYLDRETRVVGQVEKDGQLIDVKVYGNPLVPEFSDNQYPFTYQAAPNPNSERAWATAPPITENVQIWVTHGPPMGRLDDLNTPGFVGCSVLAAKIAETRPLLCVFGHFHYSWGVERVQWSDNAENAVESAQVMAMSRERATGLQNDTPEVASEFDFPEIRGLHPMANGDRRESIFVNASWMASKKRKSELRNRPIVISLAV